MRHNKVALWCVDGGVFMEIYGDYGVDLGRFRWRLEPSRCHFSGVHPQFSPQLQEILLIVKELQIFSAH